jgi:hypothetical protein
LILLLFNSHKETQKRVAGKTSAGGRQLVPSFLYKRPGFVFRLVAPGGEGWGMTVGRMGFQWSVWGLTEADSRFFRTLGSLSSGPSCRPVRIRMLCFLGRIDARGSGSSQKMEGYFEKSDVQKSQANGRFK